VSTFYETLDYCFEQALRDILGRSVQGSVYELLERNRIPKKDISSRFNDVAAVLLRFLGSGDVGYSRRILLSVALVSSVGFLCVRRSCRRFTRHWTIALSRR